MIKWFFKHPLAIHFSHGQVTIRRPCRQATKPGWVIQVGSYRRRRQHRSSFWDQIVQASSLYSSNIRLSIWNWHPTPDCLRGKWYNQNLPVPSPNGRTAKMESTRRKTSMQMTMTVSKIFFSKLHLILDFHNWWKQFKSLFLCICRGLSLVSDVNSFVQHAPQQVARVYNSHSSNPMKLKYANGPMLAVSYTSPATVTSAPAVVSATSRMSVPSSGAVTERIPRLVSGRTDWAAKYLKTSTKYSKWILDAFVPLTLFLKTICIQKIPKHYI